MNDQTPQDPVTPFHGTALVERPRPAATAPSAPLGQDEEASERPVPERIGRYRILAPLAQGGMARVFIAQRDGASGVCVLKQLLGDLERNDIAARRFRREGHVASFLMHENVARVIDAGEEDGAFYIAMEFIEGKDIESMSHEMLATQRLLPYPVSLTAICGILSGLAYAHRAVDPSGQWMQVVHRDLSPRNMMLTFDGTAKVIDFGMAKGSFDSFKTSPGMVLGTLRFVSPEQATAMPVDLRSDLYSVAVVLQELLTGHMVVHPAKPFEMMRAVVHDIPPRLTTLNATLPAALDPILARGLAKKPEDRFQSAEEFRAALMAAVPEWCSTPSALLADFMREQFPAAVAKARYHLALGGASLSSGSGAQKTRTVMAADLAPPPSATPSEGEEWVRPVTMVTNEVALTTRTGLVFPEVTRTAAGVPTIILRQPDLLDTAEDPPPRVLLRDSLPPQPVTAQVSMPPTMLVPAPPARAPRDRWAEMRGALIASAVFVVGIAAWRLLGSDGGASAPGEVVVLPAPGTAAPAVSVAPVGSSAVPSASPAASSASPVASSASPVASSASPAASSASPAASSAAARSPRGTAPPEARPSASRSGGATSARPSPADTAAPEATPPRPPPGLAALRARVLDESVNIDLVAEEVRNAAKTAKLRSAADTKIRKAVWLGKREYLLDVITEIETGRATPPD